MTTLTTYISIWFGLILVGYSMFPEHYIESKNVIMGMSETPVETFIFIMRSAYTSVTSNWLLSALALTGVATSVFSSYQLGGGGFSLLFAIPLLIILAVFNMFLFPTTMILDTAMPELIKIAIVGFLGLMTVLTGIQFTAGRS